MYIYIYIYVQRERERERERERSISARMRSYLDLVKLLTPISNLQGLGSAHFSKKNNWSGSSLLLYT